MIAARGPPVNIRVDDLPQERGHGHAGYSSDVTTSRKAAKTPKTPLPAFIPPMLATLVAAPFDDPDWQFEIKWDGFRVEAIVDGGTVRL